MQYNFSSFNNYTKEGIFDAIKSLNKNDVKPIIVCIGSDLVLGDSLGPLVGTMLKKNKLDAYVYGTLNYPITAKEVEYVETYLRSMHGNCTIIAIDAAVGSEEDVGLIKVCSGGLKPGLGVNKDFSKVGDISVIGVVAPRSKQNVNLFNLTRLNLIYRMAEMISDGIANYIYNLNNAEKMPV